MNIIMSEQTRYPELVSNLSIILIDIPAIL